MGSVGPKVRVPRVDRKSDRESIVPQPLVDDSGPAPIRRLSELRNPWWFPDHLVIAPLWRDLREAGRHAKGVLLDLGCGNVPYRPWFEGRTTRYVTADLPPLAPGVDLACDSSFLPFAKDCFDTVLCTQMLEHTPTPWLVSCELHRVLRPEGVLILSCPQYWPAHEVPHDYFRFTVYGLRALFPEARWEWLAHRQQGSTWAVIGCALWQSFSSFGPLKRLAAFFLNPLFTLLDAFWQGQTDTTNHVVVLRKRAVPMMGTGSGEALRRVPPGF